MKLNGITQGLIAVFVAIAVSTTASAYPAALRHYKESYLEARQAMRQLQARAMKQFEGVLTGQWRIPSQVDGDLTLDTLYIPAQEAPEGLVVLASGVHGVEGFVGSAVQRMILADMILGDADQPEIDTRRTGYLFLHAVNPYGFKYLRRVSENNVDLNRNFESEPAVFQKSNPAYRRLDALLNPRTEASAGWGRHLKFLTAALVTLARSSLADLNQAIAEGQYENPRGIFFGGNDFEPQRDLTRSLVLAAAAPYRKVLILDFHTGYGKKGAMHLYPNPPDTEAIRARWQAVFGDYPIEDTDSAEFYSSHGDFSTYLSRELETRGKQTVPMLVEYGTLDSHTHAGAIASVNRMILENQLHWYGARAQKDARRIRRNFREMFYPSGEGWRRRIMERSVVHLPRFLRRFHTGLP